MKPKGRAQASESLLGSPRSYFFDLISTRGQIDSGYLGGP